MCRSAKLQLLLGVLLSSFNMLVLMVMAVCFLIMGFSTIEYFLERGSWSEILGEPRGTDPRVCASMQGTRHTQCRFCELWTGKASSGTLSRACYPPVSMPCMACCIALQRAACILGHGQIGLTPFVPCAVQCATCVTGSRGWMPTSRP